MPHRTSDNPIAYSAAMVVQPLPEAGEVKAEFPVHLMHELLMNMFHDPVHTQIVPGPAGVVAALPGQPGKIAELSANRVMAKTGTAKETAETLAKLYEFFSDKAPAIQPVAYGLNFEFEFSFSDVSDSSAWLVERFLKRAISLPSSWTSKTMDVSFRIESIELVQRNVQLQPRAGKPNYFFASVNNHFACAHESPKDAGRWEADLTNEYEKTKKFILDLLEGTGNRGRGGAKK